MGTLLKNLLGNLVPRDYIYAALLVAVVAGAIWYTYHERNIGASKYATEQQKVAQMQQLHNADLERIASLSVSKTGQLYEKAIAIPPVGSPDVVCVRPTGRGQLPAATAGAGAGGKVSGRGDGSPAIPGASTVNIGPPLDAVGRDADAQVTALQAMVRSLLAEQQGSKR